MIEPTLAVLKPSILAHPPNVSAVLKAIKAEGFTILKSSRQHWRRRDAEKFYAEHLDKPYGRRVVEHAISGPCLALALLKENAIKDWRALIGPTHVYAAQWTHPGSLRARYGISDTRNGFHGADSEASVRREFALVFEGVDLDYIVAQSS